MSASACKGTATSDTDASATIVALRIALHDAHERLERQALQEMSIREVIARYGATLAALVHAHLAGDFEAVGEMLNEFAHDQIVFEQSTRH